MDFIYEELDKVILIPASFGAIVTCQQLVNDIREYEALPHGMDNKMLLKASGKQNLGGGKYVGITMELQDDWRIQFEARVSQTFCAVTAGNLVPSYLGSQWPIKASANVNVIIELDTSAALIEGSGSPWSEAEKDEVMAELDSINAETDKIVRVLGLVQENFRIKSQVYDAQGNLTSATIRIYNNATDAQNDVSPLAEYQLTATYDVNNNCTSYLVVKV